MQRKRHVDGTAPTSTAWPRVKVLHVLEAIEGGTARHIVNVVRHVDADHVVVVPPERVGGLTDLAAFEAMDAAGARIEIVDMRRLPARACNGTAIAKVHRLIRSHRPQVVHGHSSAGGAIARIAASGTGAARIYTPHGVFPALSALAVERALGRLTERLVALSSSEANVLRHLRLVPDERLVVIPNGVELDPPPPSTFDVRAALGVPASTPIVGTVARLVPQKSPSVFVQACARIAQTVPDARFVMVGDGPLRGEVEARVAAERLHDRFVLLRGRTDGARLMSQFTVFALPSRYEAAPYTPLEAMRAGVPVVMTDVGGAREIVDDGRTGFVVPMDDPGAVAAIVTRLLAQHVLRERVVAAARERLAAHYSVTRSASQLLDLYRHLARRRRGPGAPPRFVPERAAGPAPQPALAGAP